MIIEPKTASGKRILSLSPTVAKILNEYRIQQLKDRILLGSQWVESDFVFRHETGVAMYTACPYQWFRKFLERSGLPHLAFHGLRHTNASLLISADEDVVTLAARLGHADKNITLNIYSHALKSREKKPPTRWKCFIKT